MQVATCKNASFKFERKRKSTGMEIMVKSEDVEIEFIDGDYVIRASLPHKSVVI